MRIHDGCRHQFRCLIAGVAEHQTLVAGALLAGLFSLGFASVHPLRDIRTLGGDRVEDQHALGMKDVIVIRIADLANGLASDGIEIELRFGRDFAADHDEIAFGVGFASDATG